MLPLKSPLGHHLHLHQLGLAHFRRQRRRDLRDFRLRDLRDPVCDLRDLRDHVHGDETDETAAAVQTLDSRAVSMMEYDSENFSFLVWQTSLSLQ